MTDDPLLSNTVNTVDHRPGVMPVYPENTEYRDGQALYTRPFFNTSACETFGMEGNVVPLLQYNGCDTPDERVDSGIVLSVGDTVGDVMSVTVDLPEPDEPGGGYEESSHVGEIAGSRVEVSGSFPAGAELSLALSALTDEQKAEMAKASDQLGALIVSAWTRRPARRPRTRASSPCRSRSTSATRGRASGWSTGKPTARSKRRRLRWKEVSRA